MPNKSITVPAHGKVNWTLDVHAKRSDGLHEIRSVMQRIELADQLTFEIGEPGIRLRIIGPESNGVPADESNIVWKTAVALGVDGVDITVDKKLPNQAGLGGGSSDAASTLLALNELFGLALDDVEIRKKAVTLGADVSFFLQNRPAIVGGYGDIVTPIDDGKSIGIVILKPDVGVSTSEAYSALDHYPNRLSKNATASWPHSPPSNDFEEVVFALYPDISEARRALYDAGVDGAMLCGSGAAMMGWGPDISETAKMLQVAGYEKVWLTRTI
jgi:4-diphosphocytidyl-2-C-methyl-D-erythritol kinase